MEHRPSQTKIVATIGPASASKAVMRNMFEEGIDVCRLNFSHGTYEEHAQIIRNILELNAELGTNVAIMTDLQGPKIRVGDVENDCIDLEEGAEVEIVTYSCISTPRRINILYEHFARDAQPGDRILIDDGKLKLEVLTTDHDQKVTAKVIYGGSLASKKGVNLPDTDLSLPSLTEKDRRDAEFILEQEVDWIALSFVRSVTDIIELQKIIRRKNQQTGIMAKIEKPEALKELDDIIDASDGIMVARGDLGVEVPFDRVPVIQKEIVQRCISHAKPVLIATQMMESMIYNFHPTRAEANDVANAVIDGADALMLSAETSIGKFPVQVIRHMQKIIDWTERKAVTYHRSHTPEKGSASFLPDSICLNASNMAQQMGVQAIVTFTYSGYTAFRMASHRPCSDIFAFTRNPQLSRKLSLVWGVRAFYYEEDSNIEDAIRYSVSVLKQRNLIGVNNVILHVGTTPHSRKGRANMVRVCYV